MDNNTNPTNPNPTNPQPTPPNPPVASPFSNYPPMGTMTIGTPAGAMGTTPQQPQPQGAAPMPSSAPIPTVVPTTYGDNHMPEGKHNKTILIIIIAIVGLLILGGIIVWIIISNGNSVLSCSNTITEQNVTYYTEFTVNFKMYVADSGSAYQKITFPYHISERYAEEYREALKQSETDSLYDTLSVRIDGNSIITEGSLRITNLGKNRIGKSKEEVIDILKEDGFACREK